MKVRVLLFGQLKDIIGRTEDSLDLESGARISEVMGHYARTFPGFEGIAPSIACAVNQEYAAASTVLREGDEVGLLPPVSGGKSTSKGKSAIRAWGKHRVPPAYSRADDHPISHKNPCAPGTPLESARSLNGCRDDEEYEQEV